MRELIVASIVEGETEVQTLPSLLTRIGQEILTVSDVYLSPLRPIRVPRSQIVRGQTPRFETGEQFHNAVQLAVRQIHSRIMTNASAIGAVLVLFDADEDCPKEIGPFVLQQSTSIDSRLFRSCVIANRELENWFKAAAESLAGINGLPNDLRIPESPEVGSGENWLTAQMQRVDPTLKYTKPNSAKAFIQKMNLQMCRENAPSFDKLCRDLERIISAIPESSET